LQVGLLNVDGYYNSLLSFIDKAVEEGFINPSARHIIVSAPTPRELVKKMEVLLVFILVLDRPDAWEGMVVDICSRPDKLNHYEFMCFRSTFHDMK